MGKIANSDIALNFKMPMKLALDLQISSIAKMQCTENDCIQVKLNHLDSGIDLLGINLLAR